MILIYSTFSKNFYTLQWSILCALGIYFLHYHSLRACKGGERAAAAICSPTIPHLNMGFTTLTALSFTTHLWGFADDSAQQYSPSLTFSQ